MQHGCLGVDHPVLLGALHDPGEFLLQLAQCRQEASEVADDRVELLHLELSHDLVHQALVEQVEQGVERDEAEVAQTPLDDLEDLLVDLLGVGLLLGAEFVGLHKEVHKFILAFLGTLLLLGRSFVGGNKFFIN